MTKETFKDSSYSLSKGLSSLNIAKEYFEDVRRGSKGGVKELFTHYLNKIEWVIKNVTDRLPDELRLELNKDLSNTPINDAINDNLLHLSKEQKEVIENLTSAMRKGEQIFVEQNQNY